MCFAKLPLMLRDPSLRAFPQVSLAYVEAAGYLTEPVNREPPSREAQLMTLKNTPEFDILVIGGGATGCGCALDAVTRGESLETLRLLPIVNAVSV